MPTPTSAWLTLAACAIALCACETTAASMPPPHLPETPLRRVEAPTEPFESTALAEIPSMSSDRIELAVAFPDHFDAAVEHPILITQVTSDSVRSNIDALAAYAPTALAT